MTRIARFAGQEVRRGAGLHQNRLADAQLNQNGACWVVALTRAAASRLVLECNTLIQKDMA